MAKQKYYYRKVKGKKKKVRCKMPNRPKKYKKKNLREERKQTTRTGSKFNKKRDYQRKAKRP